ncbi:MAG TPA: hypothetical protein ENI80_10450 [Acidiferrobacteraceae bacterium]|nr:hypothetical protein [Acidiferrobacteraceae bacterium]
MSKAKKPKDNKALSPDNGLLVQELALFMDISSGELKLAMNDAGGTMRQLIQTFMTMVTDVQEIKILAEALNKKSAANTGVNEIIGACDKYLDKVQAGTVGFQFYDKLTQRLRHASKSMQRVKDLLHAPDQLNDESAWQVLKDDIHQRYNTEEDRKLYQAIIEGLSIDDALSKASKQGKKKKKDIELF